MKDQPDADVTANTDESRINPLLKLVLELGPLVVFFFGNARGEQLAAAFPAVASLGGPIFIATGLFMVATVLALVISWVLTRTIPMMPLVSGVVVVVFGALTLWLQDETFIKIKPTIVNVMFGSLLLGGLYFFKVSLLRYVFDAAFKIDEEGWTKLTQRWGLYFFAMAILNEIIWRNFSTDFWVAFKVWGFTPLAILFTLSQMPLMMKHSTEPQEP